MKARYECFVYNVEQVENAVGEPITKLIGLNVGSLCLKSKTEMYRPGSNMPMPEGGFNLVQYKCEVKAKY